LPLKQNLKPSRKNSQLGQAHKIFHALFNQQAATLRDCPTYSANFSQLSCQTGKRLFQKACSELQDLPKYPSRQTFNGKSTGASFHRTAVSLLVRHRIANDERWSSALRYLRRTTGILR